MIAVVPERNSTLTKDEPAFCIKAVNTLSLFPATAGTISLSPMADTFTKAVCTPGPLMNPTLVVMCLFLPVAVRMRSLPPVRSLARISGLS